MIFIQLDFKKDLYFLRSILTFDTEIQRGDEIEYCEKFFKCRLCIGFETQNAA